MSATDEQRGPARIATISALMVVSTFVAGKAARDAILLSHFSVNMLPLFIGISAVISLPVVLIAGRMMAHFGPARLVPALNVFSGLLAIAEWVLLPHFPRLIAVTVFIHLNTASGVLVSGFWSIVNERFDVQTAKRHIGRIGMGATLGGILGGVIAERTAVYLQPDLILIVLAVLQLACAVALLAFGGGHKQTAPAVAPSEGAWTALKLATKSPLLRNIGIVVILGAAAAGIMDYVFKADIVGGASHDSLLRSLAVFYTVTNVITAVIQVTVCGPLISKLGVPRSVGTLPGTVTAFGLLSLVVPVPLSAAVARAAELITRNSIYRSGYELLYAPLPEESKRPTKVVLDVGADKIGDILGAQLVSLILYVAIDSRFVLLLATLITGVLATIVAMRLPRSYTKALETSLLEHAAEIDSVEGDDAQEPRFSLTGIPSFGSPEVVPLRMRGRPRRSAGASSSMPMATSAPTPPPKPTNAAVVSLVGELRSGRVDRIKRALSRPLAPEVAAHVIDLVGRDDVAREAIAALTPIAPKCTGLLVDAMCDQDLPTRLRGRLPAIIARGEASLATWGLWKALGDPSFDVRYRAGAVLSRLAGDGHFKHVTPEQVYEAVRRELVTDPTEWRSRTIVEDLVAAAHSPEEEARSLHALEHVFRVLGLVLPSEPLRIALHAMQTDDTALRATALEYLESILPADVRAQLWPLLEAETPATPAAPGETETGTDGTPPQVPAERKVRPLDELVAELHGSYASVLEKLKLRGQHN